MASNTPARRDSNGHGQAPARQDHRFGSVRDLLIRSRKEIQTALPKHMDAERLVRVALTSIRLNPALLDCSEASLLKSIMQSAQLGLEPDGLLGQAYLVPYGKEAQLIIGYKGLTTLARRSGQINSISAHVVYAEDEFSYSFGLEEHLKHVPANTANRGEVVAAWAIARFKDGGYQFEVMNIHELEAIRKMSKMGNRGAWESHRPEMYRKTILRRLCKFLPLSAMHEFALLREEAREVGESFPDTYGEDVNAPMPPAATRTEALAQALEAGAEETEPATAREPGSDDDPSRG